MCTASKDPCILGPQFVKVGEKKGCLTWGSLGGGGGGASERPGGSAGRPAGRTTGQVGSGGPAGRLGRPNCRPVVRPAESAGRHRRRAEPPEPNRPSRTAAEGTAGSFRPTRGGRGQCTVSLARVESPPCRGPGREAPPHTAINKAHVCFGPDGDMQHNSTHRRRAGDAPRPAEDPEECQHPFENRKFPQGDIARCRIPLPLCNAVGNRVS